MQAQQSLLVLVLNETQYVVVLAHRQFLQARHTQQSVNLNSSDSVDGGTCFLSQVKSTRNF